MLGVTVAAASGDNGSSDGVNDGLAHVDFPASSQYVLGCGGTRLVEAKGGAAIKSEVVWNDGSKGGATGGGVSSVFPAAELAERRPRPSLGEPGRTCGPRRARRVG